MPWPTWRVRAVDGTVAARRCTVRGAGGYAWLCPSSPWDRASGTPRIGTESTGDHPLEDHGLAHVVDPSDPALTEQFQLEAAGTKDPAHQRLHNHDRGDVGQWGRRRAGGQHA